MFLLIETHLSSRFLTIKTLRRIWWLSVLMVRILMMMKTLLRLGSRHHNSHKLLPRHNYWSQGCPAQGKGHQVNCSQTVRLKQNVFFTRIWVTGCDQATSERIGLIPVSIVKSLTPTISHPISKTQLQKYFGSKIAPTFGLCVANGFSVKLCVSLGPQVQHAAAVSNHQLQIE